MSLSVRSILCELTCLMRDMSTRRTRAEAGCCYCNQIRCRQHFQELAAHNSNASLGDGANTTLRIAITLEPRRLLHVAVHVSYCFAEQGYERRALIKRQTEYSRNSWARFCYSTARSCARPFRALAGLIYLLDLLHIPEEYSCIFLHRIPQ